MTRSHNLGLRIISLVLCLACLLPLMQHVAVTVAEAEENAGTMTTVVRKSGYYSAAVIGQMIDGTEVTVLGERREFYKVDCYDMTGYIAKSQIEHTEDGKYYVNCVAGSGETSSMAYMDHADALALRHSLLALAKEQLRSRYVYGGSRPGAFDCSGLTSYLYAQHGISLYRSATAQLQNGIVVAKEGLQVGDLIFFREGRGLVSHVGIYVGNNQMIHASSSNGVEYEDLDGFYCSRYYLCARRIVNTGAAQLEEVPAAQSVGGLTVNSISGRTAR